MSDEKERELERQASLGDENAKHKLLALHLRNGKLNPVPARIVDILKKEMEHKLNYIDELVRSGPTKRLTPKMRREKRDRQKNIYRPRRRKS